MVKKRKKKEQRRQLTLLTWYCILLHLCIVTPFYCVQRWNETKERFLSRKLRMSPNGKHEECCLVFTVRWRARAIPMRVCV